MYTIIQDEAARVHACKTSLSDFEWAINTAVKRWQFEMGLTSLDYRTAVQQYWKEKL